MKSSPTARHCLSDSLTSARSETIMMITLFRKAVSLGKINAWKVLRILTVVAIRTWWPAKTGYKPIVWFVNDKTNTQTTNQKYEANQDRVNENECCFPFFFFPEIIENSPGARMTFIWLCWKTKKQNQKKTYTGIMQTARGLITPEKFLNSFDLLWCSIVPFLLFKLWLSLRHV